VIEVLSNEPRRRALGEGARRLAEARYAWPRIAGRLDEIYSELVGGREPAPPVGQPA
jgi:glycosyltransferase involved in cell wall biosynthesis